MGRHFPNCKGPVKEIVKSIEEFTKPELYQKYLWSLNLGRKACFEEEDDSFLNDISVSEITESIKLGLDCLGVVDMFIKTNLNPEMPNNQNVRVMEFDDPRSPIPDPPRVFRFEVFKKDGWKKIDKDKLVDKVLSKNRLRFYDIETQLSEILGEHEFKRFDGKLDELESMADHTEPKDDFYRALEERLMEVLISVADKV